jgi:hypothetical protein
MESAERNQLFSTASLLAAMCCSESPEAWRDLESAAELLMPNKAALTVPR